MKEHFSATEAKGAASETRGNTRDEEASEQEAAPDVDNDSCRRGRRREHKCERLEQTKKAERKEDNNNNN